MTCMACENIPRRVFVFMPQCQVLKFSMFFVGFFFVCFTFLFSLFFPEKDRIFPIFLDGKKKQV